MEWGFILCVQATLTEIANIVGGFEENSTLPQHGLFLGGVKYMVIQGDPGAVIRGKKVMYLLDSNHVYMTGFPGLKSMIIFFWKQADRMEKPLHVTYF